MGFAGLTLLVPNKQDEERDAVATAWVDGGGAVLRVDRFWDPPDVEPRTVRLYGNDTFCLVLEQKLGLALVSPPDDLLLAVGQNWTGRRVEVRPLANAMDGPFPAFVKPLVPKVFGASVYKDEAELRTECVGLDEATPVLVSQVVRFVAEARSFLLDGRVMTGAVYDGEADVDDAKAFAGAFVQEHARILPMTCVLDVGLLDEGRWAVIEANATWGAGLNGCDAHAAARCIARATTRPDAALSEPAR